MAAVNEISPEENDALAKHVRSCPACKQSIEQYNLIAAQAFAETSLHGSSKDSTPISGVGGTEQQRAKEAVLAKIGATPCSPLTDEDRTAYMPGKNLRTTGFLSSRLSGWAVAAALLAAVCLQTAQYWVSRKQLQDATIRTVSLQRDTKELRRELAQLPAGTQEPTGKVQLNIGSDIAQKLRAENAALRQSLGAVEAARHRDAGELAQLEERVRLLQSSLDVLQASNVSLKAEEEVLSARISGLTADLRNSQDETAKVSARNEELSQEALTKVRYAERQQKLLATDRDIRDILGARSLHIIDVYDVSSEGEFERPFGRIFYTEGKSLIFYAFDLDEQKGLKQGAVFRAWGQKGEGKETPRSLGVFYMDDPAQNRWVLKVDDSKALSRVDYVFVTDSSRKEGARPKGKPLLSASLTTVANHP